MVIIAILLFFSGFAALTYELLWFRHLGLVFGNTVYAASTVTSVYMLGLALGAYVATKIISRIRSAIKFYGIIECLIGVYALCVPVLFFVVKIIYRYAYREWSDDLSFLTAVRFLLGLLVLLFPAALMGATLPILARGFLVNSRRFAARLGLLYGVNTLGAVGGILATAFIFIPSLGISITNYVAVSINLIIGVTAILVARKFAQDSHELDQVGHESKPDHASSYSWLLLLLMAVSGFLSLGLEVVWFRALILVFGSTTYSFAVMLAIFLLGIALGSMALGWLGDYVKPVLVFAGAEILVGLYTLLSLYWYNEMPSLMLQYLAKTGLHWGNMISAKFVIALIFLFVPTVSLGVAFTAATRAVRQRWASSSRTVGVSLMYNTIGSTLGACVAGFILLPLVGIKLSLTLFAFLALAIGFVLLLIVKGAVLTRSMLVVFLVAVLIMFIGFPPRWDKQVMAAGPYFSPWTFIRDGKVMLLESLKSERLLFYKDGVTSTVSTSRMPNEQLYFSIDGKIETDTSLRGDVIQKMIGHLPMLFHPNPRKALNIGMGSGVTLGALGCYPLEQLDVVEIELTVTNAVAIWADENDNILANPSLHIIEGDGRNHLFCTEQKYDVITSDPFEPVVGGAGALFTVNHFELARDRLADGGIMCQWVPMYELSNENFATIIRSFVHVFPDSYLFFTGRDILILGMADGRMPDPMNVKKHFNIDRVRCSLAKIGFTKPEVILGMFVADMRDAPGMMGKGILNTDAHPVVEFSAPRNALRYMSDENQLVLLANFTDLPQPFLDTVDSAHTDSVRNSHKALRKVLRASILREEGRNEDSVRLLVAAVNQAPDNPVVRNELVLTIIASANELYRRGDYAAAYMQFQICLQYHPKEFWALYRMVTLSMRSRQFKVAEKALAAGLKYYPDSPLFIGLRGKYRGTSGDLKGACSDLKRALDMLPQRLDLWQDYVYFLQQTGDKDALNHAMQKVAELSVYGE